LEEAFTGYFTDHHRLLLTKMLARIDALSADIAELETVIGEMIAPFVDAVARLDEIPGSGPTAAAVVIAESGSRSALLLRNNPWVRWGMGVVSRPGPGALAHLGDLVAAERISIVLSR
jgi:transposase